MRLTALFCHSFHIFALIVLSEESVPKFDITFKNLAEKENRKELFKNIRTPKQNHRLLDAVAESERFGNIGIGIYVNEIEKEIEKQFSAVTFKLSSEKYYIAFRGTG